ncbi:MAG: QacE family quaternary ammonium compound efflux SMR transporter [Acidovorax sp.]|uniref:SMR family transporter n=1 Tax=unclassified Diaphorobacter TaxID=2649760 RepID=UPI000DB66DB2|nr:MULTISPECIES: SMR family transporter [unclassified Diaphorobacter]PZU42038.1 MAG: QacE family quaternary ammonium compound efflux SMR transporter [Acidovorax sp.]QJY33080.1 QacE family quaternary ammonium compound efflux SMR transporter [Diaphorobacter sp. JS3050]QPN31662.1 QacE family quaternary ammonium compound efflux SMR transporter [Diaphorobacter sp. JS3051]
MHPYLLLGISIMAEVVATSALKSSQGLTRLGPSALAVLGYCVAFYLVSKVMNHMATGVVYAVWSGLGIVLISLVGWLLYGQKLDLPAVVGMAMIVGGVLVIQLLSKVTGH